MTMLADPPPPEFVSDRLILRRFDDRDARFVLELHANPDLIRFIPTAAMSTREEAVEWISTVTESAGPTRGWWCVTLHDGIPVGAVVLKPIRYSDGESGDEVEIGWRFHADFTGKGFATEAGQLLLAAGFASGLDRIIAVVRPDNPDSQAVSRGIGLKPLGPTTRYYDTEIEHFEATAEGALSRQVTWIGLDDPARRDAAHVLLADGLHAFGRQICAEYAAAWTVDARDGWITTAVHVAVQGSGWRRTLTLERDPRTGDWAARTHRSGPAATALPHSGAAATALPHSGAETARPGTPMPQPGIGDDAGAAGVAALAEALDCDLGLCPLTNTMPIRRLHLQDERATDHELTMAWIDLPSLEVSASRQIYTSIDPDRVRYTSGDGDFTSELSVDRDGIVRDYPGLAERVDPPE